MQLGFLRSGSSYKAIQRGARSADHVNLRKASNGIVRPADLHTTFMVVDRIDVADHAPSSGWRARTRSGRNWPGSIPVFSVIVCKRPSSGFRTPDSHRETDARETPKRSANSVCVSGGD